MASIFLGTCAAAAAGPIHYGWLAVTVLGIFAVEVAKNASGEIFDFDSGADLAVAADDRSPFSGGKRVLVDGLLTRRQTAGIAIFNYSLGAIAGLAIVAWCEPSVLWIGLAGFACAIFYQTPPLRFSYRGLGELAVAISFGPLICLGAYLVQRHAVAVAPLLVSIPHGLLVANFLLINEFPDFKADRSAGKRTLVVRLGRRGASTLFVATFVVAFAILLLLPLFGLPPRTMFGAVAVIPAALAALRVRQGAELTAAIIPAQALTLVAFLLNAIGVGLGFVV